jgi:hypothetical protein
MGRLYRLKKRENKIVEVKYPDRPISDGKEND